MAVYVNTNVSSLNGRRYLNNVQNQLTTTYQRLSSGMRINSAKDDAAGLQIADRLTTQINGLNRSREKLKKINNLKKFFNLTCNALFVCNI